MLYSSVARDLMWRLRVIGIPADIARPMSGEIQQWVTNSGPEWTINRLKSLKVDLFRSKADLPPLTWVRKNRKGRWHGWLGTLFDWSSRDTDKFAKSVQSLMSYTYFVSNSLTENQKKKFLTSVQSSETYYPDDLTAQLKAVTNETIGPLFVNPLDVTPLVTYQGSHAKKAPVFNGPSVPQDEELHKELEYFLTRPGLALYHQFRERYSLMMRGIESFRRKITRSTPWEDFSPYKESNTLERDLADVQGGVVRFLQEPGFKCRSIASPFRAHQLALRPLGKSLFNLLKTLPWDCTFDQQKALPTIQKALKNKQVVHCIDLSAATDYFPLSLQESVLKTIYGEDSIDVSLFSLLSRSLWKSNELGPIRWTRGQPLGLYPSFAAFGLTHGLLLLTLAGGIYRGQFFVVGDDVIILDSSLAEKYRKTLDLLECPYSPDKTISSDSIAEFAGKVITDISVMPQLKWRSMSDDNFMDLMRLLGQRARVFLTKRQKRVYDRFSRLLPPMGCNHSSGMSLPFEEVYRLTVECLEENAIGETAVESLVDLAAWITRKHGYQDDKLWQYLSRDVHRLIKTFDEKVQRAFQPTVFGELVRKKPAMAKGLSDLPEVSGNPILPTPGYSPNRLTTLEWYEGMSGGTSSSDS